MAKVLNAVHDKKIGYLKASKIYGIEWYVKYVCNPDDLVNIYLGRKPAIL